MSHTIRPATQSDQAFIREMLYEALFVPPDHEPFPRSVLDQPDIAHYADGFGTHPGDVGLIAETTGERVAAAWVRLLQGDDRGYGHIDDDTPELSVAVRPRWRNQGIGTALLLRLVETLPRVSLSVDSRNPAVRLYEQLGFEVVAVEHTSLTMLRQP